MNIQNLNVFFDKDQEITKVTYKDNIVGYSVLTINDTINLFFNDKETLKQFVDRINEECKNEIQQINQSTNERMSNETPENLTEEEIEESYNAIKDSNEADEDSLIKEYEIEQELDMRECEIKQELNKKGYLTQFST
jgi:hypothetical protein